jgi:hypothetical protein
MPANPHALTRLLASVLLISNLAGCASINEKLASGMGDYIPQWAGGLPAGAPPRPGTPEYDAYMKERERQRQMPASERDKATQSSSNASAATPTR